MLERIITAGEPDFLRRTWIDIDLDALTANYRTAAGLTKATLTCVIKANAYGHGAIRVAEALEAAGCRSFAVSCAREALELRREGIRSEVLVLGLTEPEILARCIREDIALTAGSEADLLNAQRAAEAAGREAVVHLKIDTGFHRLGFPCTEETADRLAALLPTLDRVRAQAFYSHLGLTMRSTDETQHARFLQMDAWLKARGVRIPEKHLCDSIGLVRYPDWHYDRVRAGAFLFGVRPSRSQDMPFECKETLALRTTVARVHDAPAGEFIGYDEDAPAARPMRVATLCAGYGDGYQRHNSYRAEVLIRGKRAPVIGLLCMDQLMVDVTGIPDCAPGDVATLLGDGITLNEAAGWAGTNRNECLTLLSRRPVRVYHQDGRIVTVIDEMLNERRDAE